ncbi:hypothetical protein VSDG_02835 [Cytospora chrysosperma]|uniref:Uncharacterized protein n=1 Tax=Cytospora chrysosperma TaxID=252740 RepID=A0A423WCK2_CYTCH|nr:hypothetical protein VSDG_02835 [Valsa sordida]
MPQHIAQAPPDPRLLDETKSNIFRGIISDRGDSVALQSQYFTQRRKNHELPQGPAHDPNEDFPTNVSPRQKVLVGQIFDAIRNKTGLLNGRPVRDDQGQLALDGSGNVLRKPDANTKRVDELADVKVEMLCWDILYGIKDAHEGSLYGTEWTWAHSFNYEPHETFMQRFEKVVDLLSVSKRAVCDLLEASWLCRIANAPSWELSRKRRNKDGNERKSDVYKEGKRRIQSQASIGLDDYAEEGDHGIAVATRALASVIS